MATKVCLRYNRFLSLSHGYYRHCSTTSDPLPISQMPGPKGLSGIADQISTMRSFMDYSFHENNIYMHKKYGPVFKTSLGPLFTAVFFKDPKHIEQLFRIEGKYPGKAELVPWVEYRKQTGKDLGVLLGNGESWHRARSALNPHMLRPMSIAAYTEQLNEINDSFLDRLTEKLDESNTADDLKNFLFKWSLESASLFLFEQRIGGLEATPLPRSIEFFNVIKDIQKGTLKLFLLPIPLLRLFNAKSWNDHVKQWDLLFEIADSYCLPVIDKVQNAIDSGEEVSGFIASMLKSKTLSMSEIQANLTDFLTAAVDTTSSTMCWALYELGENPDKQQKAYEEVQAVLPADGRITAHHVTQLRYLKAVVKETLRLHPPIPILGRIVEEETVIGGYKIPPKTIVNASNIALRHDPDTFDNPTGFIPERWLRDNKEDFHPFATLPFGFGARGCIGRRLAELEMYLLIGRMLQLYTLKSECKLEEHIPILMEPKNQLTMKFIPRN